MKNQITPRQFTTFATIMFILVLSGVITKGIYAEPEFTITTEECTLKEITTKIVPCDDKFLIPEISNCYEEIERYICERKNVNSLTYDYTCPNGDITQNTINKNDLTMDWLNSNCVGVISCDLKNNNCKYEKGKTELIYKCGNFQVEVF